MTRENQALQKVSGGWAKAVEAEIFIKKGGGCRFKVCIFSYTFCSQTGLAQVVQKFNSRWQHNSNMACGGRP